MTSKIAHVAPVPHRAPFRAVLIGLVSTLFVLHTPWPGRDGSGHPGAVWAQAPIYEGFGAATPGGSGGDVVRVTNLNDSGGGSFREAVSHGHRTVVFDVSGTIELGSAVHVAGAFVTIDGFSAPAPGITLRGRGLVVRGRDGAHDIIIRGLRVRDAFDDGIQIAYGAYNVVVDHVSIAGSGDGNLDITESSHDITIGWSILAAPAAEKNMLIKYNAARISVHHNVFIDAQARNPLVATDDAGSPATDTTADLWNNLVWNWGSGTRVQTGAWVNAANNFYASPQGSSDDQRNALRVCTGACPEDPPGATTFGRLYASGNFSADRLGFAINDFGTEGRAFATALANIDDTCLAAYHVVAEAGAHPRDALDQQSLGAVGLPSCAAVFVKSLYYHALGQVPGDVEVQASLESLGSAPAPLAVWSTIRAFFDSDEFRANALTPSGYVTALHRAALGRDPDSEALAFYTGEVLGRFNTLLPLFVGSQEFGGVRAQTTPVVLVTRLYRQALGRIPTDAEVERGVEYLMATDDITPGVAALLNSDEFTSVPRTFARHVRLLHRALFGREPSATEEAFWVDYLAGQLATLGGRSAEIVEFETRVAQIFHE